MPKGTPAAIIEKVQADIQAILASDEYQQKIAEPLGYVPVGSTPKQFSDFLAGRRGDAQRQIRALNIKLD